MGDGDKVLKQLASTHHDISTITEDPRCNRVPQDGNEGTQTTAMIRVGDAGRFRCRRRVGHEKS